MRFSIVLKPSPLEAPAIKESYEIYPTDLNQQDLLKQTDETTHGMRKNK